MSQTTLSLEDFKRQVVNDYRTAHLASATLRSAQCNKQTVTQCCCVAQVALAKALTAEDRHFSQTTDLAFEFAAGRLSAKEIFQIISLSEKTAPQPNELFVASQKSNNKNVTVLTLDASDTKRGAFWEILIRAIDLRQPLALVVWSSGSELPKLISGFVKVHNISALSARGADYPSLCTTFAEQIDFCRRNSLPSLTMIEGDDDYSAFAQWITSHGIAPAEEIKNIDAACEQAASM